MEILTQLEKIETSETFLEWKAGNPQAYLSSMFVLIDGERKDWQAGYYEPTSELTATFLVDRAVTLIPPSPTFKEPQSTVLALDISQITLDLDESLTIATAKQREFKVVPLKTIVILQHLPMGMVYNITYVTTALSTLNIKVDAMTKEIREAKLIPIVSWNKLPK